MKTCWKTLASSLACLSAAAPLLAADAKVDFVRDVKPILEGACIQCHGPDESEADLRLDTKAAAFKGNENGPGVIPGKPEDSPVVWTTELPHDDDLVMPPKKQLPKWQQALLRQWVAEGAEWPETVALQEKPRMDFKNNIEPLLRRGGPFSAPELHMLRLWAEQGAEWPEGFLIAPLAEDTGPKDDLELVKQIHARILENQKVQSAQAMEAYTATIPKTGAEFTMLPIPAGEFLQGSPETEAGRTADEGPQRKVQVAPFWMGKHEVTWDEYDPFMNTDVARRKDGSPEVIAPDAEPVDVTSSPTTPYQEMSFGMGTSGYPAISMTQHAALKYCQWLSAQTGHFYRLPTEAEWEYAARAGTTTAYSWGDDPSKIGEYAWFWDNADDKYQKVGQKKPNPWGLHDMHGNLIEWTLDAYLPEAYERQDPEVLPWVKPGTNLYPRVARGGSWYDSVDLLRSAARTKSHSAWKIQDPQLPKSIWYMTDAQWLGFRIVRPMEIPSAEEMHRIWNQGRGEENDL